MQRLEVSGAVRLIYKSLGVKVLICMHSLRQNTFGKVLTLNVLQDYSSCSNTDLGSDDTSIRSVLKR